MKSIRMLSLLLLLLLLLALAACAEPSQEANDVATDLAATLNKQNAAVAAQSHKSTSPDGGLYKADLLEAISRADRIVVTEHSNEGDDFDPEAREEKPKETIVYGRVEMSAQQRTRFASIVSELSDETQDAFPACIFEPHHSIEFYAGTKLSSTMEICFLCGQVEWKGSTRTPPWALYSGLDSVIKSVGLSPEREWRELAISRRTR